MRNVRTWARHGFEEGRLKTPHRVQSDIFSTYRASAARPPAARGFGDGARLQGPGVRKEKPAPSAGIMSTKRLMASPSKARARLDGESLDVSRRGPSLAW